MASGWNSFRSQGPSQGDPLQFLLDFQGTLLDFKGGILRFLSDLKWMPLKFPLRIPFDFKGDALQFPSIIPNSFRTPLNWEELDVYLKKEGALAPSLEEKNLGERERERERER